MLVAADDPCIQHVQVHQVAKAEAAGDGFLVSVRDRPDRHPFKVGPQGIEFTVTEITLIGVVVLSTVPPGVVGYFVVIPDSDERHLAVQLPQMIIAPVNRVAMAVILQGDELTVIRRRERTAHGFCLRGAIAIRVAVVLIEIIPQMQHGIQVIQARDFPIHVEVAGGVIGAGHHGKPHLAHRTLWKGLRHAGRGGASGGAETVVIALAGHQTPNIHLECVIVLSRGARAAGMSHAPEVSVGRNFPGDVHVPPGIVVRYGTSPEDHAILQGVATGNALREADITFVAAVEYASGQPCGYGNSAHAHSGCFQEVPAAQSFHTFPCPSLVVR